MTKPSVLGLSIALALTSQGGCSSQEREHPPYVDQSCEGAQCRPAQGPSGGGLAPVGDDDASVAEPEPPASPSGSSGDSEGTGAPAGAGSVLLDPQEASDLERTLGQAIGRPYSVYAWPTTAPLARSTGQEPQLVPVAADGQWLLCLIKDANDALDPAWFPTLTWQVPSTAAVAVPVFHGQFWEDLAVGLAVTPTTLDPQFGHVLLRVTDDTGTARLGVAGEVVSGTLAYGNGGSASDVLTETDDSGLIVWFNAPVGDTTTLTLATADDLWTVVIPTRSGAVTVAAVAR